MKLPFSMDQAQIYKAQFLPYDSQDHRKFWGLPLSSSFSIHFHTHHTRTRQSIINYYRKQKINKLLSTTSLPTVQE